MLEQMLEMAPTGPKNDHYAHGMQKEGLDFTPFESHQELED
jgi:hypothetical protein